MIKYLGSKRLLVPLIGDVIQALEPAGTVVDLFSGTARVGHALKGRGYQVRSNDLNAYAATIATCYVQADAGDWAEQAVPHIARLNALPGKPGYFTETFCRQSRFFQPHNGERVDAIRDWIAGAGLPWELEAVLLTSLMEAADRVDSTTGVQMAYLKQWAARSHKPLSMRLPALLPQASSGKGAVTQLDAGAAAQRLSGDIGYLDPPYNQHKYLGNYHIWETLVRWDSPEPYGVACKRQDCRERRSPFNSRPRIHDALQEVVRNLDVRHLVVSFSNEGYISREEMIAMLSARGDVFVLERAYRRYVGARIGIYNPGGDKVGAISHLSNKEYLFVVPEKGASCPLPAEMLRPVDARDVASSPAHTRKAVAAEIEQPLVKALQNHGSLSSERAQKETGASAADLRPVFHALLRQGRIRKTGQGRGTVYHWIPGPPPS